MSLISRHLEQISVSSESIASLPFPPPRMFTNALLTSHDITSLIRDTEPHERALFSVPSNPTAHGSALAPETTSRRQTVFAVSSGEVTTGMGPTTRAPRRHTAVAAVLGPELHSQVKKTEGTQMGKQGEIDVHVLLRGAEKLNEAYAVKGVPEKIAGLRARYAQLRGSVDRYEQKVLRQTRELERMNRGDTWSGGEDEYDDDMIDEGEGGGEDDMIVTDEDLRKEEEEIRELEKKKKGLEDRVSGMERDLGGLLR